MIILKFLVLIASIFACVGVIRYRLQMVQFFGKNDWAEKYLGGSYNLWVLIGVAMVFMAATWLFK